MKIRDSMALDASGLKLTRDGYLVGEAKVSRAGNVQRYLGSEIGLTGDDAGKTWGVYRDPDVVFDESSMMSLAGRPVTRGHPPDGVSADSWRELSVGQMGGTVRRDGEHVIASMAIMDAIAAKEVSEGARSLSAGYTVDVVPGEGTTESGESYQYRQSGELRFNHVAYLPDNNPRAGNTRIGDWHNPVVEDRMPNHPNQEGRTMAETRKVVIDGLTIDTTDQGAQAIEKLQKQLTDADQAQSDLKTTHDAAIAAKDAELGKKDGEIDDLKKQVMSDEDLDKAVAERADLIGQAKAVVDGDYSGQSPAEIRKTVCADKLGADKIADQSDDYIKARFDMLVEQADSADPVRAALNTRDTATVTDNGYTDYVNRLTNAYKQEAH